MLSAIFYGFYRCNNWIIWQFNLPSGRLWGMILLRIVDVLVNFEAGHTPGYDFFLMEAELSRLLRRKVDFLTFGWVIWLVGSGILNTGFSCEIWSLTSAYRSFLPHALQTKASSLCALRNIRTCALEICRLTFFTSTLHPYIGHWIFCCSIFPPFEHEVLCVIQSSNSARGRLV